MERNLLFIDDDRVYLNLIQAIFKKVNGIKVCCVESGKDGLKRMEERFYDLVFTDYHMPDMDGLEFARRSRSITPDIPIVIETCDQSEDIRKFARETKIVKVVDKPYNLKQILEIIDDVPFSRRDI